MMHLNQLEDEDNLKLDLLICAVLINRLENSESEEVKCFKNFLKELKTKSFKLFYEKF